MVAELRACRFRAGNRLQLLENGVELFPALREAIDHAQTSVHLETYIFKRDRSGSEILAALKRAASRGVTVRVVLDGFGSADDAYAIQQEIESCGGACRLYRAEPKWFRWLVFHPDRLRRLHRKITVIDGETAFIGGINMEDDFPSTVDDTSQLAPRYDYAVRITGPLVADAIRAVNQVWLRLGWMTLGRDLSSWREFRQQARTLFKPRHTTTPLQTNLGTVTAGLVLRDNLRFRRSIEQVYLHFIREARHEIIIANAYFLPGRRLRQALQQAALRGVRVRLLLQGRVEYRLQSHATRWIYDLFLDAGVEILEYMPSHLHGKVAVLDDVVTVGSSNLDPFSLLLAREANVVVQDALFASQLRTSLEHAMSHGSMVVDSRAHGKRPVLNRALDALSYLLVRIGVAISGRGQDY